SAPAIAAIVPTHNRAESLRCALEALISQDLPPASYEVIVVANACTDATPEVVDELQRKGPVRLVEESQLGLHYARHAGARSTQAPILAYTDDDAVCSRQWLRSLLSAFQDPKVGCTGGPIKAIFPSTPPSWTARFGAIYGELDHGSQD